ncbi:MAG: hypothetical protein SFU98_12925 [Leptospiraceae bacterium]|nr:hypothetical protein [Leptospiraceae bacterium]
MNDIFEPNNNFSEAKCLDEKKIPSGLFIFYLPLFPNSNQRDVDYYYLNLSKDKPFSLVQSEVKTNLGYQIEFYDQNLQPIQINFLPINLSNEIKFQEFSYTPLTTGKYYFKIQLKSSESYNGIYTLNFKVNGYGDYTFSYANPCEGN